MHDLWSWIENKAFNPRTAKDKLTWLRCFHRFLPRLWKTYVFAWRAWNKPVDTNNSWCSDKDLRELRLHALDLKPLLDSKIGFSYSINKVDEGFSVRLFYSKSCFQIDYAEKYLYEFSNNPSPDIEVDEITKEDIEEVIEKRIYHPALHTHLKKEDGGDYYHHLRFGFATNNPFVILYQVAFQIIDYQNDRSAMRKNEISRLTEILHSNKDKPEISAGTLFHN